MTNSDRFPFRRRGTVAVFPVVRWDPDGEPESVEDLRNRYTITSVFTSQEEAEADAARLNEVNKGCTYFWTHSRFRNVGGDEPDETSARAMVQWRLHINARDEQSARKVVARIADEIGREVTVADVERYWRGASQQVVRASTPLAAATLEAAVFEVLRVATAWSYDWSVGQPEEFPDGSWAFEGHTSGKFRVAGVEFATFEL